jgi:hypothetical protein
MAERISDNDFVKALLSDGISRFLPTEASPAEPYWALFAIDRDGKASGTIWCPEDTAIVLFESREEAQKVIPKIGTPTEQGVFSKPSVAWAARGVSREYLKFLRSDHRIELFIGALNADGMIVSHPLPKTHGEQ